MAKYKRRDPIEATDIRWALAIISTSVTRLSFWTPSWYFYFKVPFKVNRTRFLFKIDER